MQRKEKKRVGYIHRDMDRSCWWRGDELSQGAAYTGISAQFYRSTAFLKWQKANKDGRGYPDAPGVELPLRK